jgi:16S rRNA (cytidine1402-2'-O)-methyltransferase
MSEEKNRIIGGMLYLVATPIGNMADISARAIKALSEVDFVAAEDTRNTARLLGCLSIKQHLVSYHEHNKYERGAEIVNRLVLGESCALVTDAGMPAISDPGADLVRLCAEKGVPVTVIPGCCAAVTALALSGLSTTRFSFEGFLPVDSGDRKRRLSEIAGERRTMIFYEAPHKLVRTLCDLLATFGDRKIALCRELTKMNEEIVRTTLEGAVALYSDKNPRGEYVLIVEGGEEAGAAVLAAEPSTTADMTPMERVDYYCQTQGLSRKDAMKVAAKEMGISKSELYKMLLPQEEEI